MTMRVASVLAVALVGGLMTLGCRNDAAPVSQTAVPPAVSAPDSSPASNEVTVRIRKLGGPDGQQVMNQIMVTTRIADDFTVTEQVGTTQLELRGKVLDLKDGLLRVACHYTETSAAGRQELKSNYQIAPNSEAEIGGLAGADGMERVVLSVSTP